MRFLLQLLCTICLFLTTANVALAREYIETFVSKAQVNKVGVMKVTESIEVDALRHVRKPLYRIIDTRTFHSDHTHRFNIKVDSVTDSHNKPVKYSVKNHRGAVSIRLHKSHIKRGGKVKYVLKYEVRGIANFHESHPQLVWDVTGHNWPVEIKNAAFELSFPSDVQVDQAKLKAWNGAVKKESTAEVNLKGEKVEAHAKNIEPGESLRVEVNFPMGTIGSPGLVENLNWLLSEWYLLIVLPLMAVLTIGGVRFFKTRMASPINEEGEIWSAPESLRPVEVGTLIDQSCDVSDVSVTLINLAVRGYYTVREIPATGFFALSDRDYEFKKLSPPKGDQLKEYESIFLEAIFGNSSTSYLSNIQGVFRGFLPDIRSSIYKSLVDSKMLAKNPEKDKVLFGSIGFTLAVLGVAILFLLEETSFMKALGLGLVLAGIIISIAPSYIPLRTDKGKKTIDQLHLFAETIKTASDRDIESKLKEDKFLFHKLLPYAIIFGVFEKWAQACEDHLSSSPDWFQFYVDVDEKVPEFSASKFAKDVWMATKIAGLTFTAPPPREYSSHTVGKFGTRKEQDHNMDNRI